MNLITSLLKLYGLGLISKTIKKNYFFSFLISMIMNLYVKYTSDIKRNKCKKKMFWL
jgi:hypothetical protein